MYRNQLKKVATLQFTTFQALTLNNLLDLASVPFGVLVKAKSALDSQEAYERGESSLSSSDPLEASSSDDEEDQSEVLARTGKIKEQMKRANKHA